MAELPILAWRTFQSELRHGVDEGGRGFIDGDVVEHLLSVDAAVVAQVALGITTADGQPVAPADLTALVESLARRH